MTQPGDDLDRMMAVMDAAFDPQFGEAWNRRQVEDALLIGNCHYGLINAVGAEPGEAEPAAGFYLSRGGCDEEELLLLAISPRFRRKGLARALLNQFAQTARDRGKVRLILEMRRDNPAEFLYLNFGFKAVGVRPNYYRKLDGSRIDAITMTCE